jgi:hypothetical protein
MAREGAADVFRCDIMLSKSSVSDFPPLHHDQDAGFPTREGAWALGRGSAERGGRAAGKFLYIS